MLSHGGSQLVLTWAANQCNLHFQCSPLERLAPGRDSTLLWVYGAQNRSLDKELWTDGAGQKNLTALCRLLCSTGWDMDSRGRDRRVCCSVLEHQWSTGNPLCNPGALLVTQNFCSAASSATTYPIELSHCPVLEGCQVPCP